jgi:putative transposase
MPRHARIVLPGVPHHITQRGNNKSRVFFSERDRLLYLALLRDNAKRYGLDIRGYCLMTNHVHVVAVPLTEDSLAEAIGRTHQKYSLQFNRRYARIGHLWQGRFHSCPLDQEHYWCALSYAERNPVRAGIVWEPWDYRWSSARAHIGQMDRTGLLDLETWRQSMADNDWRLFLERELDEEILFKMRQNTHRGWPVGSDEFVQRLEKQVGRRLRPGRGGRPPKDQG